MLFECKLVEEIEYTIDSVQEKAKEWFDRRRRVMIKRVKSLCMMDSSPIIWERNGW